jgi:hypothetical protein
MYYCEGCTCGELVEVTGFPVFQFFLVEEKTVMEGVVGSSLQSWGENRSGKERAKEVVQTSKHTGVKSHWVVKAQCKSSMSTRS